MVASFLFDALVAQICLQRYKLFPVPQTVCDSCDNKIFIRLNIIIIYIIYYIYNNKIIVNIFSPEITVTIVTTRPSNSYDVFFDKCENILHINH